MMAKYDRKNQVFFYLLQIMQLHTMQNTNVNYPLTINACLIFNPVIITRLFRGVHTVCQVCKIKDFCKLQTRA